MRENELYFYVTDIGTGIPKGKMERVFERFTKPDAKRQDT